MYIYIYIFFASETARRASPRSQQQRPQQGIYTYQKPGALGRATAARKRLRRPRGHCSARTSRPRGPAQPRGAEAGFSTRIRGPARPVGTCTPSPHNGLSMAQRPASQAARQTFQGPSPIPFASEGYVHADHRHHQHQFAAQQEQLAAQPMSAHISPTMGYRIRAQPPDFWADKAMYTMSLNMIDN